MSRTRALPLGVDIGTCRVRVARAFEDRNGIRVHAVAARDVSDRTPEFLGAIIEELVHEVGGRERRCVGAIGYPSGVLRSVRFPTMTSAERVRAARFEAQTFVGWDVKTTPTQVRVFCADRERQAYVIGAARLADVTERLAVLRCAGLRPVAMDHEAFALRRALPVGDAVLDIGADRATLHVYDDIAPRSSQIDGGGSEVTRGIATDLSIDESTAERRKRILGPAGAGGQARDRIVRAFAESIERARNRSNVTRVVLTGNGSRLPGIASALETATGSIVELPVSPLFEGEAYPEDVLRSAAPDWTMAVGLAAWGASG